ncbi:MAG TPA: AraC family transcriptional regulator [Chitinophaga sp.]
MLNDCYQFKKVMREVTSLTPNDCFSIVSRRKSAFTFPLHTHEEMELTLLLGGAGLQRMVGDHMGAIGPAELVLVGPGLPHGWFSERPGDHLPGHAHMLEAAQLARPEAFGIPGPEVEEVTLLFSKELFSAQLLGTDQLLAVRKLLEDAKRGVLFPPMVVMRVQERLRALAGMSGFGALLEFLSLLHTLAVAEGRVQLSEPSFTKETVQYDSRRLERAFEYMHRHYASPVTLAEIARIVHMSEASFSRFMKANTGYTFTEKLTEIRLGHVSRLLVSSRQTIAEIAYQCGFNNMANFNKLFKRRKGCTPKTFRGKFNEWKG